MTETILNETNVEAVAALAYIAEVVEGNPEAAFTKTLGEWRQWLDDEGYTASSVEGVINSVLAAELDAAQRDALTRNLTPGTPLQETVQAIHRLKAGLVETFLAHVDHGAMLHAAVLGVSGGTARRPDNTIASGAGTRLNKVQHHLSKELGAVAQSINEREERPPTLIAETTAPREGVREAIADAPRGDSERRDARANEFSAEFGNVEIQQGVPSATEGGNRDARAEFRETNPGELGATEGGNRDARAEFRETNPGELGATEGGIRRERMAADVINTAREGRSMREDERQKQEKRETEILMSAMGTVREALRQLESQGNPRRELFELRQAEVNLRDALEWESESRGLIDIDRAIGVAAEKARRIQRELAEAILVLDVAEREGLVTQRETKEILARSAEILKKNLESRILMAQERRIEVREMNETRELRQISMDAKKELLNQVDTLRDALSREISVRRNNEDERLAKADKDIRRILTETINFTQKDLEDLGDILNQLEVVRISLNLSSGKDLLRAIDQVRWGIEDTIDRMTADYRYDREMSREEHETEARQEARNEINAIGTDN